MEAKVRLMGIVLRKYAPYIRDVVNFNLSNGIMNLSFDFHYKSQPSGDILEVDNGQFELKSLQLDHREDNEKFLDISSLVIKDILLDLTGRQLSLGSFTTTGGYLLARLSPTGEANLARAFKTPVTVKKESVTPQQTKPSAPWHTRIGDVLLDDYTVRFQDYGPTQPVEINLDKIKIKTSNLAIPSPPEGHPLYFSTRYEQSGNLVATGEIKLDPIQANLRIKLTEFDLKPIQPYVAQQTRLVIKSGALNSDSSLVFNMNTGDDMTVAYRGRASITNFSATSSDSGRNILRWNSLDCIGIEAGYNPTRASIHTLEISRPYALIVLNPDGNTNIADALSGPATKPQGRSVTTQETGVSTVETAVPKSSEQSVFKLDLISLKGGNVDFIDNYVAPGYKANLSDLNAKISGMFARDNMVDLSVAGKLNKYSPVKIVGKFNMADYKKYFDMKMNCDEIGLTPFTPYSSKYLGYLVAKGKLSLKLIYNIRNKSLEAENHVYMDQFNFGNKVESKDATTLPVKLAVSLFKDRNGVIDLNVPVTGDLSDPKVNVWKLIIKALEILLKKVATAPFAALGSVVGAGEELGYVDFQYGKSDLSADQKQKLDKLIDALSERPAVSLEIQGEADPLDDGKIIKRAKLDQLILERKRKQLAEHGETFPATSEIKIKPSEYERYVRTIYENKDFRKPEIRKPQIDIFKFNHNFAESLESTIVKSVDKKNLPFMAQEARTSGKSLTTVEMEQAILGQIEVTDEELAQLARDRANIVMNYILAEGRITPDRVSLVKPEVSVRASQDQPPKNRAVFSLQ